MTEKVLDTKTAFSGRLISLDVADVEMDDGKQAVREIVRHPGAVAILGCVPDGRFVLVRQYRMPVEKTTLEAIAGTLHAGEDPQECAKRETREETGHDVTSLTKLGMIYPSPGFCDEQIHLFSAALSGERSEQSTDEDEKVDTAYLTHEEVEQRIVDGRICDAKTLSAWLLYAMGAHA